MQRSLRDSKVLQDGFLEIFAYYPQCVLDSQAVRLKIGDFVLQRSGDLLESERQLFALGGRVFLQR